MFSVRAQSSSGRIIWPVLSRLSPTASGRWCRSPFSSRAGSCEARLALGICAVERLAAVLCFSPLMTALDRKITPRRLFYVMRRELADCRLYSFSARKPGGCGKTAYGAAVQAGSEVPPARVSCADAIGAVRVDVASSWEPSRRRASRHTMILFTTGRHPGEHGGALRLRIFGQPALMSRVRRWRGVRPARRKARKLDLRRDPFRRADPVARSPAFEQAAGADRRRALRLRRPMSTAPDPSVCGGSLGAKRYDE